MIEAIVSTMTQLRATFTAASRMVNDDTPLYVKVELLEEKRRSAQNRRYWALLHQIAEQLKVNGNQMDAETWHEWAKRRFIGVREICLPDGELVVVGKSSTDLRVREFGEYMECLEAWAVDQGVVFNDLPE